MSEKETRPQALWEVAEQLSSPGEADDFFQRFAQATQEQGLAEAHARAVFNTALQTLVVATQHDPQAASQIIFKNILPICLEQASPIDGQFLGHDHLREFCSSWIDQYNDEQKFALRQSILRALLVEIETSPRPALWTITAIGFRSPEVEERLIRVGKRRDEVGNLAIACLSALQPPKEVRSNLVRKILRRLPDDEVDTFSFAIQGLCDPQFVPVIGRRLIAKSGDSWRDIALLGRIADRIPGNRKLQDGVWRVMEDAAANKEVLPQLLITGNGVAACNTPTAIRWLVYLLEQPNANANLIFSRLKECVRPEQLDGWLTLDKPKVKRLLTPFATLAGPTTRSMTLEAYLREYAWETALSAGITGDISDWLATILEVEPSGHTAGDVFSFASFIRLESWPEAVDRLVRERVDLNQGANQSLHARANAILILRAAGTKKAFQTLLDCGLLANGAPLRSTAEALGDLAEQLALEDLTFVLEHLLKLCEARDAGDRRMLAVAGLQRLANDGNIPGEALERLIRIAQDDSLPAYATSAMIWTVSWLHEAANSPSFVTFLIRQVDNADADVRFQSIQALVHLEVWEDQASKIIEALGLRESGGSLVPTETLTYQGWQAHILALLAARQPDRFLEAAKAVQRYGDGAVAHVMLQAISRVTNDSGNCKPVIATVAIDRALTVLGRSFGETDNFALIARLAPVQFAAAPWEDQWGEWMPGVRAALAESLQIAFTGVGGDQRERVLHLLETLLNDSTYQVRRVAARSFSRLDCPGLEDLSRRWIRTGQTELRCRSAEIAQWLPLDNWDGIDNEILRQLSSDPEPSVRSAAVRSQRELRNRTWCAVLLDRVASGDRSDGNKWLSEVYSYARAIASLGDDETIEALRTLKFNSDTPLNIQNLLASVSKDLENHWRDVARKWPEPWLPWSGQLEELEGTVMLKGKKLSARISLWCRRQADPTDTLSWGGGFSTSTSFALFSEFNSDRTDPIPLLIEGRRPAHIWLSNVAMDDATFIGTGPYPAKS